MTLNHACIDHNALVWLIWRLKTEVLEQSFQNRMQSARADIGVSFIHRRSHIGNSVQGLWLEDQVNAFSAELRGVLPNMRVRWFRQNSN